MAQIKMFRFDSRKVSNLFFSLLETIRKEQGEARGKEFSAAVREAADAKVVCDEDLPTYWLTASEVSAIAQGFVKHKK